MEVTAGAVVALAVGAGTVVASVAVEVTAGAVVAVAVGAGISGGGSNGRGSSGSSSRSRDSGGISGGGSNGRGRGSSGRSSRGSSGRGSSSDGRGAAAAAAVAVAVVVVAVAAVAGMTMTHKIFTKPEHDVQQVGQAPLLVPWQARLRVSSQHGEAAEAAGSCRRGGWRGPGCSGSGGSSLGLHVSPRGGKYAVCVDLITDTRQQRQQQQHRSDSGSRSGRSK